MPGSRAPPWARAPAASGARSGTRASATTSCGRSARPFPRAARRSSRWLKTGCSNAWSAESRATRRSRGTHSAPMRRRSSSPSSRPVRTTPKPQTDRLSAAGYPQVAAGFPGELLDVHPRDRPRDDQLLDLGGALEDVVDLGVAVPALDRELARVAVAAENLDRALGNPHGHLSRLQLAHRALGVLERDVVASHPRSPPDEQAGGVDLELHPGERERDRLVLDDLASELLALLGVLERVLVGGSRDPKGLRADGGARGLEGHHGRLRLAALAFAHARDALI